MAVPLKSGYLLKKVSVRKGALQRRWFIFCNDGVLTAYKEPPTTKVKELASYALLGSVVEKKETEAMRGTPLYCLEVSTADSGLISLSTPLEAERDAWFSIMDDTVKRLQLTNTEQAGKRTFAETHLQGFLDKKSYRKHAGASKMWSNRRFFVLEANKLKYYRQQTDVEHAGCIIISGLTRAEHSTDAENAFVVRRDGQRDYVLKADTQGERDAWVDAITKVARFLDSSKRRNTVMETRLVDAVDFEAKQKAAVGKEAVTKALLQVPPNDVKVVVRDRPTRTLGQSVPAELIRDKELLPKQLQDCISVFTRPFLAVEFTDRTVHGSGTLRAPSAKQRNQQEEVPPVSDRVTDVTSLTINKEDLPPFSEASMAEAKNKVLADRQSIFRLFCADVIASLQPSDPRLLGRAPCTRMEKYRALVECQKFEFDIGDVEPLFGSIFLWDTERNMRLTETYFFSCNTQEQLDAMVLEGVSSVALDVTTQTRKGIFLLDELVPSAVMVVLVKKIASGELDSVYEIYSKGVGKPKKLAKYKLMMEEVCLKNMGFNQLLAWGSAPMCSANGELAVTGGPMLVELQRVPKDFSEETLSGLILNSAPSKKASKPVGGLVLTITDASKMAVPGTVVDTSLVPVSTYSTSGTPSPPAAAWKPDAGQLQRPEADQAPPVAARPMGAIRRGAPPPPGGRVAPKPPARSPTAANGSAAPLPRQTPPTPGARPPVPLPAGSRPAIPMPGARPMIPMPGARAVIPSQPSQPVPAVRGMPPGARGKPALPRARPPIPGQSRLPPSDLPKPAGPPPIASRGGRGQPLPAVGRADAPPVPAPRFGSNAGRRGSPAPPPRTPASPIARSSPSPQISREQPLPNSALTASVSLPSDPKDLTREVKGLQQTEQPHLTYLNHLFVYPKLVNASHLLNKDRSLFLEISLVTDDSQSPSTLGRSAAAAEVIYGGSCTARFTSACQTTVVVHTKKAAFLDEVKIALPATLRPGSHLLFCLKYLPLGKKASVMEEVVGYSVIPLVNPHTLQLITQRDFQLFATGSLPAHYTVPEVIEGVKTLSHRPVLDVSINIQSSVYTNDLYLQRLFVSHADFMRDSSDSNDLHTALRAVKNARPVEVNRFLPVILDTLFGIIVLPYPSISVEGFWAMISLICKMVGEWSEDKGRQPGLSSYVEYLLDNGQSQPYDVISFHWSQMLSRLPKAVPPNAIELTHKYAWFLFQVITKTMVLDLHTKRKLGDQERQKRFSGTISSSIEALLTSLIPVVQAHTNANELREAARLNAEIGMFLKDLLNVMDRGVVMRMIGQYVRDINPSRSEAGEHIKFQFLTIVCDHEHYIPLNLPVADVIDSVKDLSTRLWKQHYLAGVLLHELSHLLVCTQPGSRAVGIEFFRNLLLKHELDPRYQMKAKQSRIAGLYLPFLVNLVEDKSRAILSMPEKSKEKHNWLVCLLFLLKQSEPATLQAWWRNETVSNLRFLFSVLNDCLDEFELQQVTPQSVRFNKQKAKECLKGGVITKNPVRGALYRQSILNAQTLMNGSQTRRIGNGGRALKKKGATMQVQGILLYHEVSLTILTTVLNMLSVCDKHEGLFEDILSTTLLLMKKPETVSYWRVFYKGLQQIIWTLREPLFKTSNPFVGFLLYELMRHSCFDNDELRCSSLTLLITVFKLSDEMTGSTSHIREQAVLATSKIVGEGSHLDQHFVALMKAMATFLQNNFPASSFKTEMLELTTDLTSIVHKCKMISESTFEAETTADCYVDIAESYGGAPGLQLTWLDSLAQLQLREEHWVEAAQCYIQQTAIIASLLAQSAKSQARSKRLPIDLRSYLVRLKRMSPGVGKEFTLPDPTAGEGREMEGVTFDRLLLLLSEAMDLFKQESLYELATEIGRLMAHIYQEQGDYAKAAFVYEELESFCLDIVALEEAKARGFNNFFLARFYGKGFGPLDGQMFVYKEKHDATSEFLVNKISLLYQRRYGRGKIQLVQDEEMTQAIPPPNEMVVKINRVRKGFDGDEKRVSEFERNFGVETFVLESQFVAWMNNEARPGDVESKRGLLAESGTRTRQASVADRKMLKHVLTTELPFPCTRKRLRVVKVEKVVLSPVENSITLVGKLNSKLRDVLSRKPVPHQLLQTVLWDVVNEKLEEGKSSALDICRFFFAEENRHKFEATQAEMEELSRSLKALLKLAAMALKLYIALIDADQRTNADNLSLAFAQFKAYVENSGATV